MSLTTVAAPIQPDEQLARLPPSHPERFQARDFIAGGLVFLITLGVYIATLAPSVTLEDSGELITAATKFGVPHPPGYPTWTMSGFLVSHLVPFGSLAWRMNLQSALFAAAANAVLTLLFCHSGRWLLQRWTDPSVQSAVRPYVFYTGILTGLALGFSNVMWSQAVYTDVRTLNALFVTLVLIFFYFWLIEPQKTHRLIIAVFVYAIGLTHHHTLIQFIPAILGTVALLQLIPFFLGKPAVAPMGTFFSVFLAINLFSLSILTCLSWLSEDPVIQLICHRMALIIFVVTAVISFFYLKEFRWRLFLLGAAVVVSFFAYGYFFMGPNPAYAAGEIHPGSGWMQNHITDPPVGDLPPKIHLETTSGLLMMGLGALALGLLFTSKLDRRLIIGVFAAGWVGLMPYSYEHFASNTHPPMNWGFASDRNGFYYEVTRLQYPKALPNLIKTTFGKAVGVVDRDAVLDESIGQPNYWPRLGLTIYYYGENLEENFTVPLLFVALAILLYFRRCDWLQVNWFIFLGLAFFFVGFLLYIMAPQEGFDFEHNLQYKVFHLPSHCILVLLMGYGALAAMTYLHEAMPEVPAKTGVLGFGIPGLFLALLPLWSNFDECSQAGHWFGYNFGADIMRHMDKNAVYLGGSDFGRFVPTYMAFVESQQPDRWKSEPGFDRRDVTVITQNALCDTYYSQYIRFQYDPRFRPKPEDYTPFEKWLGRDRAYPQEPVTCVSENELRACWDEYRAWPEVKARIKAYGEGAVIRPGTNDVFEINGIVAQKIFEKNKKTHTFYLEQSVPIPWMYPYLLPEGLIFKMSAEPLDAIPPDVIEKDRLFWDAYSKKLLDDPKFQLDDDATGTFGKLAFWHSDLYRMRHLDKEQEYWLKMSLALCPHLQDAVRGLADLLATQKRFDEAIAVIQQAEVDDPRNESYGPLLDDIKEERLFVQQEQDLRAELAKSPYDVALNLRLGQLLQDEGKFSELNDRLRIVAGLTNWNREAMSDVIQYYVDKAHNLDAAIAFLEARAKIDPSSDEMIYNLAAFHAVLDHKDAAMKYLTQAAAASTNAILAARGDQRFDSMRDDPRFQALVNNMPSTNSPATNLPPVVLPKPVKK